MPHMSDSFMNMRWIETISVVQKLLLILIARALLKALFMRACARLAPLAHGEILAALLFSVSITTLAVKAYGALHELKKSAARNKQATADADYTSGQDAEGGPHKRWVLLLCALMCET